MNTHNFALLSFKADWWQEWSIWLCFFWISDLWRLHVVNRIVCVWLMKVLFLDGDWIEMGNLDLVRSVLYSERFRKLKFLFLFLLYDIKQYNKTKQNKLEDWLKIVIVDRRFSKLSCFNTNSSFFSFESEDCCSSLWTSSLGRTHSQSTSVFMGWQHSWYQFSLSLFSQTLLLTILFIHLYRNH
jgi:hypothetical protein